MFIIYITLNYWRCWQVLQLIELQDSACRVVSISTQKRGLEFLAHGVDSEIDSLTPRVALYPWREYAAQLHLIGFFYVGASRFTAAESQRLQSIKFEYSSHQRRGWRVKCLFTIIIIIYSDRTFYLLFNFLRDLWKYQPINIKCSKLLWKIALNCF